MKTQRAWQTSLLITLLGSHLLLFSTLARAYNADSWREAGQVYQKVCGHCHETGIGPEIKGRNLPAAYITHVVRHGNRAMPAFRLSDVDDKTLNQLALLISNSKLTDKLISNSSVAGK